MAKCCDRCGKPLNDVGDVFAKLRRTLGGGYRLFGYGLLKQLSEIDLCDKCHSELRAWMDGKRERLDYYNIKTGREE